jgi:DNA replication initiation complex subunit (GINS family)
MAPPVEFLTFEDLTEVCRREQRSKGISEVRKDFYPAMKECLEKIKRDYEREFAVDQFSTKSKSLSNQLTKLTEKAAQVFAFRLEKILQMALRASEGNKIDPYRLTIEEKEIFDKVSILLKDRRGQMLEGQKAKLTDEAEMVFTASVRPAMVEESEREEEIFDSTPEVTEATPIVAPTTVPPSPPTTPSMAPRTVAAIKPPAPATDPKPPTMAAGDYAVIKILEDIPAFAGPGRNYRLQKEDMVTLPPTIAKALIARKKAVGVQLAYGEKA